VAFACLARLWLSHREWLGSPGVLLGGALALRAIFFLTLPDLSDDLYRYVWDGWLGVQGIRPYELAPEDPALSRLHGEVLFREMNSPGYHSIYPPLSQLLFLPAGAVYAWAGWPAAAWAAKAGFLALETAGVVLLHAVLRRTRGGAAPLALYAWNPLVLVTVAGGGHTEGALVFALALALWGVARARPAAAWIGWTLAVATKGIPLLLAPLLWRELRTASSRGEVLRGLLVSAIGGALLALPFLRPADLPLLWASADLYVRLFEFNAGLYMALREAALPLVGGDPGRVLGPLLRWIFVAGALWIGFRHKVGGPDRCARGALLIFSLYLLTATTVHPWYLLWVLPLLPFTSTLRGAWLWASAAALPTYLTYVGISHALLTALFWGGWGLLALNERRERFLRPLRALAGRRKAAWIEPHVGGRRILDVGGGEGHVARALSREGRHVVVVDPFAGTSSAGAAVRAHGERLPFEDGAADTVVLSFVLHHAEDPDRVLVEALRVARGNVVVLESVYRGRIERGLLEMVDRWVNAGRSDWGGDERGLRVAYRTSADWEAAAERAGGIVEVSDRPNRVGHRVRRLVIRPARRTAGRAPP
jgi:SAM-dependent methyltransferase